MWLSPMKFTSASAGALVLLACLIGGRFRLVQGQTDSDYYPGTSSEYVQCSNGRPYTSHETLASSWGGTLAVITSNDLNNWLVLKLYLKYASIQFFFGAKRDPNRGNNFVAADGTYPLPFTNWRVGQPNNANGQENVAVIDGSIGGSTNSPWLLTNGFWDDFDPTWNMPAIYGRSSKMIKVIINVSGTNVISWLGVVHPTSPNYQPSLSDICASNPSYYTVTFGTCGGGNKGNGMCADASCCSQWGWCGTGPDYCGNGGTSGDGVGVLTMYGPQTLSFSTSTLQQYLPYQTGSVLTYLEFDWTRTLGRGTGNVYCSGASQAFSSSTGTGFSFSMQIPTRTTDPLTFVNLTSNSQQVTVKNLRIRYECPTNSSLSVKSGSPLCVCNPGLLSDGGVSIVLVGQKCNSNPVLNLKAGASWMEVRVDTGTIPTSTVSYFVMSAYERVSASTRTEVYPGSGEIFYASNPVYKFQNLQPGRRYEISLQVFNSQGIQVLTTLTFANSTVAHCSCDDVAFAIVPESTGKPLNFVTTQDQGYVMFQFQAYSRCEQAYAFTRQEGTVNAIGVASVTKSAFTPNYNYAPRVRCLANPVVTGRQAADDLSLSKLPVNNNYTYCVRAVNQE